MTIDDHRNLIFKPQPQRESQRKRQRSQDRSDRGRRSDRSSKSARSDSDADVEVGKIYLGRVKNIKAYGAFVEIAPNTQGMVHISHLADHHVSQIEDIVEVGEEIYVKCIEIGRDGKIRLSRREAISEA